MSDKILVLMIILPPLIAGLTAGLAGNKINKKFCHCICTLSIFISFCMSIIILQKVFSSPANININLYRWGVSGNIEFYAGFLIDRLSALMLTLVSFISLIVHIYSIGYMRADPGYRLFFSYISLFTFAMFILVSANNFLQLYFGWEGVGLVSYLLIGFWFKKNLLILAA